MKRFKQFITEKNVPTNPKKWAYWVGQAKKKFEVYPSAYANGWAAKMYKKAGGGWRVQKEEVQQEDLRKWFKEKWVNIAKTNPDGSHPPCGTSGDKEGYAKCVPKSKADRMSKKEKESATRRKRAAQNKAGRGGKKLPGSGKKPILVNTKARGK